MPRFASETGLAQGSPSLEAPRLQALEIRNLFQQQSRKGKVVITKTSRHKGLVLGSFLVPEIDMIFGDGVGTSLVRGPYCELCVGLMRFYIGTAQLKKVLGWV